MAHFSATVIYFDGVGNERRGSETRSFNGEWCEFAPVTSDDAIKASAGVESKITYYPGGAPSNPIEYFTALSVAELVALANGGSGS